MIFNEEIDVVVEQFNSDKTVGLNDEQVLESREKFGYNELTEAKRDSLLVRFLNQKNPSNEGFFLLP